MSAQTVEKLEEEFNKIEQLSSGSVFQINLTDDDATSAADEYIKRYYEQIQEMIRQALGTKLDVSKPSVQFSEDEVLLSVKGGKGFLKVNASLQAAVTWDGTNLHVDVKSVDIPIVSVDPATVNSYIQEPINNAVSQLKQFYDIRSFKIIDGSVQIEAQKK